ncbi:MAG: MFS transporter [Chloroflexi bacterium]|nr:MFS transporter [Chloroflexota bacterium]
MTAPRDPVAGQVGTNRPWPKGLAAFGHRNFRVFWTGQLVSLVGTWMQTVALGWLVLELTNDPLALGIVAACQFVPTMLFGLFGGIIADVLPKRRTLLFLQAGAAGQALVLALLIATGAIQVWHVYALSVVLGLIFAVEMPVRQSFVVEIVGREDVANAVALNSAAFNGSRIIGPAIAGVLIGTVGLAAAFFLNSISYLAVMAGLLLMNMESLVTVGRAKMQRSVRGVGGQLAEGLRYVRDTPVVLLAIGVLGVVATVGLNFQVVIPVYARDVLRGDAATFGFLMAASGIGSLVSAISIAFGQRPTLRLLVVGAAVIGVALMLLSTTQWFLAAMLLMGLLGWGVIAMAATANTLIQLAVPDELRGRVMSVYTTVFAGSTPIGGLFAGTIAALAGVTVALLVGGALALLTAGVAWLRLPRMRVAELRAPVRPEAQGG